MSRRMIWADIGMALAIVGFVAIVWLFQDEGFFAPLMMVYIVAVVAFAFVCEWVATEPGSELNSTATDPGRAMGGVPLPH